jgi:hypothetical protein
MFHPVRRHLFYRAVKEGKMIEYFAVVLALCSSAAFGQQEGSTDQEREACSPDVKRYCTQVINQGDLIILS